MAKKSNSGSGEFTAEPTSEVPLRVRSVTQEVAPSTGAAELVLLAGADRGRRFKLGERTLIGRHPAAEVWLKDEGISGRHATISRQAGGRLLLRDLGSRNGTQVNGARVDEQELKLGDKISLGARTVLVLTHTNPMEDQLLQLQKMEAIGQLAAGVAHEFNNLLAVVLTNLELMQQPRLLDEDEVRVCAEEAREAASRGAELTRRMLDFSRLSDASRSALDLGGLLQEMLDLTGRIFDRAIQAEADLQPGLRVNGDRLQLYQAVMNLLINAKDAMGEGGRLVLRSRSVEVSPEERKQMPGLGDGPHVVVEVTDNGRGMSPEVLRRACEPFFTTKPTGEGTGLGLSMARSIVHGHGGDMIVESHEGQGTSVRIYLPCLDQQPLEQAASTPAVEEDEFTGTVLVVDDDVLVCRSLARTLRMVGFDVIAAESGEAGLAEYRAHYQRIRLVLLDVVMPGMSGEEVLAHLLRINPKARVLVSSGFTEEQVIRRMLAAGAMGFLRKPYELSDLTDAIRRALKRNKTSDLNPRVESDPGPA